MVRKNMSLDQFDEYVDTRPSRLGCWRSNARDRYPLLSWLNVWPHTETREAIQEIGYESAVMLLGAAHHNQVGISAGWVTRYLTGGPSSREMPEQDRTALFRAAGVFRALRNALVEVRVGVRGYESQGKTVRMPYLGNRNVDALDRILDLVESVTSISVPAPQHFARVRPWMRQVGMSTPWESAPPWVQTAFRERAAQVIATYWRLPTNEAIDGVPVPDIDAFWAELLAWGTYMHAAGLAGSIDTRTISPLRSQSELAQWFEDRAGVPRSSTEHLVQLLTLNLERCKDGALTPFVECEGRLLPMSSLIVPTSPHRNLISILQADPGTFGSVGEALGRDGERTVLEVLTQRLRGGTLLRRGIKVKRETGGDAGNLDVVACDPDSRTVAIFEIKWNIAADGNTEVYRVEQAAIDKRTQVIRLRNEIRAGLAAPSWPLDWPDLAGYSFRWFILTRDVLVMREIDRDDIVIRSHQLIERTLQRNTSVDDLIRSLDSPPIPPTELMATQWDRVHYGDVRVDIEQIIA